MNLRGKNMALRVKIKRLSEHAIIPQYAREGDAGLDLYVSEDVFIAPGTTVIVPTGIAVSLPPGYEAQIRPRSGITVKTRLRVQLGTIDSGYIGEIGIIVDNFENEGSTPYFIAKGDRIAQMVIKPVERAHFVEVAELEDTQRGTGGFGSSGVKS